MDPSYDNRYLCPLCRFRKNKRYEHAELRVKAINNRDDKNLGTFSKDLIYMKPTSPTPSLMSHNSPGSYAGMRGKRRTLSHMSGAGARAREHAAPRDADATAVAMSISPDTCNSPPPPYVGLDRDACDHDGTAERPE
ncbi:hypothetical protein FA95DRAFT_1220601 [Auriscalpium vulgare]|uniref:Uncharacterized protein n=1 Tax=Auriscalpium vulgare TaxID=40419 RepID=A0ACB8R3L0_9AGAM|nr:hypothetical protein FA95DRAFT_1220601 [Auriscalpium vulgare]